MIRQILTATNRGRKMAIEDEGLNAEGGESATVGAYHGNEGIRKGGVKSSGNGQGPALRVLPGRDEYQAKDARMGFCLAAMFMALVVVLGMIFVEVARAHPADDPVEEGGLQKANWNLGLNDLEFRALHRSYWHERRLLEHAINKLTECRGWRKGKGSPITGEMNRQIESLATYWDNFTTETSVGVAPAHPVIDSVNIVVKCGGSKTVVNSTSGIISAWRACGSGSGRVLDFEGDKARAAAEVQAAMDTKAIANVLLSICEGGGNF